MSIEFEEDNFAGQMGGRGTVVNNNFPPEKPGSGFVNFLVSKGVFKDEKTANIVILIVSVLITAICVYISIDIINGPESNTKIVPYSEMTTEQKMQLSEAEREIFEKIEASKK